MRFHRRWKAKASNRIIFQAKERYRLERVLPLSWPNSGKLEAVGKRGLCFRSRG